MENHEKQDEKSDQNRRSLVSVSSLSNEKEDNGQDANNQDALSQISNQSESQYMLTKLV